MSKPVKPPKTYGKQPGNGLDTRGRVNTSPGWPNGGMVSRPVGDRNYDVQMFTGNSVSTVAGGGWVRGQLLRQGTVEFHPAKPPIMYDPTDPRTWRSDFN